MLTRIEKTFNGITRYGVPVGRVMCHEGTLLDRHQVTRMLYSDYSEAMEVALDTVYGRYLEGAETAGDIESGLESFLVDEYSFLDEACGQGDLSRFLHLKYDFHNMKVVAKERYLGSSGEERPFSGLGTVPTTTLAEALNGADSSLLPRMMTAALAEVRVAAEGDRIDAQGIDSILDRAFLEGRLGLARNLGSRPLEAFCRSAVDVANIQVLLRGVSLGKGEEFYRAAIAEGGGFPAPEILGLSGVPFEQVAERLLGSSYGRMLSEALEGASRGARLSSLDRASDDYLMERVAGLSRTAIGPERVVRYVTTRENEVVLMRVMMVGKLNGLTPARLESRIPAHYLEAEGD